MLYDQTHIILSCSYNLARGASRILICLYILLFEHDIVILLFGHDIVILLFEHEIAKFT